MLNIHMEIVIAKISIGIYRGVEYYIRLGELRHIVVHFSGV